MSNGTYLLCLNVKVNNIEINAYINKLYDVYNVFTWNRFRVVGMVVGDVMYACYIRAIHW